MAFAMFVTGTLITLIVLLSIHFIWVVGPPSNHKR